MSKVPPPEGMCKLVLLLDPVNTTVSPEPAVVCNVKPLVSSWPFSITRTALLGASIVVLPVNCWSPQTILLPLRL